MGHLARWSSVAATFCLLVLMGLLASPDVYAAASLKLSKAVGPPTTTLTLIGSGFGAYERLNIYFDTTGIASTSVSGSGVFSKIVKVPAAAQPGKHTIRAVGQVSGRIAQASFLVQTNWNQFHFNAGQTGINPYENTVSVNNVARLRQIWSSDGGVQTSPAIVGDWLYVGSDRLLAYKAAGCGDTSCAPVWSGNTGGSTSSPAVANGVVYVAGHQLYAFRAAGCGTLTCSPLWTAGLGSGARDLAVTNGVVYVVLPQKLYAFRASGCGASVCLPLWTAGLQFASSPPAVANGFVYVGAFHWRLLVPPVVDLLPARRSGEVLWQGCPLWRAEGSSSRIKTSSTRSTERAAGLPCAHLYGRGRWTSPTSGFMLPRSQTGWSTPGRMDRCSPFEPPAVARRFARPSGSRLTDLSTFLQWWPTGSCTSRSSTASWPSMRLDVRLLPANLCGRRPVPVNRTIWLS